VNQKVLKKKPKIKLRELLINYLNYLSEFASTSGTSPPTKQNKRNFHRSEGEQAGDLVGVEPVLRSSACSPSIPRKLVRWIGRGWPACTHQCLIGGMRWLGGSDHDRGQTVSSGSMSTMTSWCVKGSNSTILNFFYLLLSRARYTASPSCFLLFE